MKLLKQPARALSDWQIYGRMYYREKLKPLIDEAFDAARSEYVCEKKKGNIPEGTKKPEQVTFWTAVAMEQFAQESEDVKILVQNATREYAEKIKALNDPLLVPKDEDQRIARLEA